ncbi:MAG: beta galactosidase jelly roll domain-containing protein [Bacteroidales bacterium]|nr:beta galactosidase jelly roll domain-containing protein [Bacteroidales bacterium]
MKFSVTIVLLLSCLGAIAQYQPAGDKIKTRWASEVNPDNPLPEYPRPLMTRQNWQNLNGLWNYAITPKDGKQPSNYEGQILVPFCVESSLSGVQKTVGADKALWYQREFNLPKGWKGQRVLLHFGAVDWMADVWVNGIKVGSHTGGYTPFSFDITQTLNGKDNTLVVRVWDPTDDSYIPHGKQVNKPRGIFYTAVTGIWQTVWLEPVPERYIASVKTTPDLERGTVTVVPDFMGADADVLYQVEVSYEGRTVASGKALGGQPVEVNMPEGFLTWTPDHPYLYDMKVTVLSNGKKVDEVDSYFAMRSFGTKRDESGMVRLTLNGKPIFHFGPLDQGWWPDGLYTAPTDEALAYDVEKTKELGFNMIRKHVKVEPARWYYHCDRLGMIVWQDMPSGGRGPGWQTDKYFDGPESLRSKESEECYKKEWKEIIESLISQPCIGVWVPFNESWGQFKTPEIVEMTKTLDPTRLVNPASGGNFYPCGDILDLHHYPEPKMVLYDPTRATVLGEYGGIGRKVEGHTWVKDQGWGYVEFESESQVTDTYVEYAEQLYKMAFQGFSAAVYTQTTDCETELNGLMTYDRAVIKLNPERLLLINRKISHAFAE